MDVDPRDPTEAGETVGEATPAGRPVRPRWIGILLVAAVFLLAAGTSVLMAGEVALGAGLLLASLLVAIAIVWLLHRAIR